MITLKERFDSEKLIKLFDSLVNQNYSPLWVDPYCVFVCKIGNNNYIFRINGNSIDKEIIGNSLTL